MRQHGDMGMKDIPSMQNLRRNDTKDLSTKQTQRTNLWLQEWGDWGGTMEGRDSQGVWDGHVHTAAFKINNQQGPTYCIA